MLNEIFNTNTIKISYSCMRSVELIIADHNNKLLVKASRDNNSQIKECNCRRLENCPLERKCLTTGVVYQATVTLEPTTTSKTYVGITEGQFKTRFNLHNSTFKKTNKRKSTEPSNYIGD